MPAKSLASWMLVPLVALLSGPCVAAGQSTPAPVLSTVQAQGLVDRALANELSIAQNSTHPMRYHLHKSTPNLSTTKKIVETRDGDVARLISVNGKPLNAEQEHNEMARLDALYSNPATQSHRKHSEDADTARILKVLKALPSAFLYHYAGPGTSAVGPVERFTFTPSPNFVPSNMEDQVLTAMSGKLWVDPAADRVVLLQGRLQHAINYGLGIIGRLDKGGWLSIQQAPVADDQWRIVHLQLAMTGRVLFFSKNYDVVQEASDFETVPAGMTYRQAIAMLRKDP